MQKPKKWTEVYPYGTQEGNDEAKFFKILARSKWPYRSVKAIKSETGLSQERIEEIISKYTSMQPPIIVPHPTNEDHWGYWERCEDQLKTDKRSISEKDQDDRVKKHIKP